MSAGQWRVLALMGVLLFMEFLRGGAVKTFFSQIAQGVRSSTGINTTATSAPAQSSTGTFYV